MNSELEKLIEKYRITVNGLADLESGYDGTAATAEKVIKERGFVTLNGLLAATADGTENAVNTENTPVSPAPVEGSNEPSEPTPSDNSAENTPASPAPVENPSAPVENPGVTPVPSGPTVSDDTNLGGETASGERSADGTASAEEENPEENSDSSEEGGKPKKKKK